MKLYIAGPCTGLPQSNYPAFAAQAKRLRALGHAVESPHENPPQRTWQDYMRLSIPQMLTCDAVVVLAGWGASRGALLEATVAHSLDMPIYRAVDIQDSAS